ncbi:MAG: alpha/beta fold hydrolase [Candidatus Dormibacteraeota bacterium]|nr:alpha/beta fold hydrolase [Candidatus Dormibacteraeota bacterium]
MNRLDVQFASQDGQCAAWLYRPEGNRPVPLVVMAHGFSATREQRLDAYAERFQRAGLGVLLFDYRHFGASPGEPRQLLDIKRQHADFHAAIAHARGLDWVDAERIALFGSSFSGGHVIAIGAQDKRVAAIVAQCPFTDGLASLPKLGLRNIVLATGAGLRDQLGALAGRPPHYIPAVGPPGSLAVMSSRDAQPGFAALTPPDTLWENRVAARVTLAISLYRPGRAAARLNCPVLFCVCERDVITPPAQTLKYAAMTPHAEVRRYPVGHFEIYVGETWERAVVDQTEFLSRSLGVVPAVSAATVTAD